MSVPAEIFRTYDIRGVVGRSLTPEIVRAIGRALGSVGRERNAPVFAVCRDGRLSGPELVAALTQGLNAAGADVIDIGMAPSKLPEGDPRRVEFGRLHATSTALESVPLLGGLLLLFWELRD